MAIKHHFFGKDCIIDRALKDRGDLIRNLQEKKFSFTDILLTNQIHSDQVIVARQDFNDADGLVTNLKNIVIGVYTADCCPILLFCEEPQIVAAIHAGWKGAKLGIIQETVKKMYELGATNICAVIGPMIQQYSYQVSIDFYNEFLLEDPKNLRFFKETADPIRWNFNLPNYVESKLALSKISEIENLMIDTYTNPQKYSSYRRSCHYPDETRGRNVAVICLN
jgi:YfiH family protein